MAGTSKITRDQQRREIVARYAERRATLTKAARTTATWEERDAAQRALQRLPRNASPTRLRNRDVADGRPRGHLRKFGVSRVRFRSMAHDGQLPDVRKSSW
jgi:small subunit ribosomal protein S14